MLTATLRNWPVTVAMFLYLAQMTICWRNRDEPGALIFFGYAVANVGFIWGFLRLMAATSSVAK